MAIIFRDYHGKRPSMKVESFMIDAYFSISATSTIREAARLMRRHGIGALAVTEGDYAVGILTDRDIVVRLLADGADIDDHLVQDAMSDDPVSCCADQDIVEAAALMGDHQIRRVLVLDRSRKVVGLLSVDQIAEGVSEELAGQALGEIVEHR